MEIQKVIRLLSIIHNGIILDLVCGFLVVVFVKVFVLIPSFLEARRGGIYRRGVGSDLVTRANYSSEDGETPTTAWAHPGLLLVLVSACNKVRSRGPYWHCRIPSVLDRVLSCSPVVSRVWLL